MRVLVTETPLDNLFFRKEDIKTIMEIWLLLEVEPQSRDLDSISSTIRITDPLIYT